MKKRKKKKNRIKRKKRIKKRSKIQKRKKPLKKKNRRKKRKKIYKRKVKRIIKVEKTKLHQREEKRRLDEEVEQRLKEEEIINLKEGRRSDDEQNKKRLNGTIKWFNDSKGYGFIKREDKEKDVFVHFLAVQNSGLKYLKKGEQLTFEVEYSDKGPSAVNLQKTVNEDSRSHLKVVK